MNTLDLNAYGVQEMSHQEMVETNGGWRFVWRLIGGLVVEKAIDEIRNPSGGQCGADLGLREFGWL